MARQMRASARGMRGRVRGEVRCGAAVTGRAGQRGMMGKRCDIEAEKRQRR